MGENDGVLDDVIMGDDEGVIDGDILAVGEQDLHNGP